MRNHSPWLAPSIVVKCIRHFNRTASMSIRLCLSSSRARPSRNAQGRGRSAFCVTFKRDKGARPHWTSRKWDESSLESQGCPLLRNALATPHPKRRRPIDDATFHERPWKWASLPTFHDQKSLLFGRLLISIADTKTKALCGLTGEWGGQER